jgi:hypothetical protein
MGGRLPDGSILVRWNREAVDVSCAPEGELAGLGLWLWLSLTASTALARSSERGLASSSTPPSTSISQL